MDNYDIHEKKGDVEAERESINIGNSNTREQSFEVLEIQSENTKKSNMLNDDLLKGIESKFTFYNRIGNLHTFIEWKGEPLFVLGPHWPFFLCLFSFISFVASIYFFVLWPRLVFLFKFLGVTTYLVFSVSYLLTALSNPGIPRKNLWVNKNASTNNNFKNFRICPECKVIMNLDENTTHCDDCEVCIEGYDHHCPWTSKCVGKGNLKAFYVFVASCLIQIVYFIIAGISLTFNEKY